MWEKGKMSKSFSTGILILIFLLLFIQLVFFVLKIVDNYGADESVEKSADVREEVAIVPIDTVPIVQKKSDNQLQRKGRQGNVDPPMVRYDDRGGDTSKNNRSFRDTSSRKRVQEPLPTKRKYHKYPIEINRADTSDFNSLYGIGAYFAMKIVEYRQELGGSFVVPEQLMEVWGIDSTRFYAFSDRLFVDSATIVYINLYTLEMDSLAKHPYIGSYAAKGIERYRRMVTQDDFTVDKLVEYNIIAADKGEILKLYHRTEQ